jgi:hypothetical protein
MESAAEAAFGFRSLPLQVTLPRRSIVSARPVADLHTKTENRRIAVDSGRFTLREGALIRTGFFT